MTTNILVRMEQAESLESDCVRSGMSCVKGIEIPEMGLVQYLIYA